jgi:nitrite reductase/ring-hydroxylating ferredoxin subunit
VTGPRHGWQFDLTTGQSTNRAGAVLKSYPVVIRNDAVYVEFGRGG